MYVLSSKLGVSHLIPTTQKVEGEKSGPRFEADVGYILSSKTAWTD